MKVYVVTSGCYSDYRINAIFLDKDKAQKYADVIYDSNPIEEFETEDDNVETMIKEEVGEHTIVEVCIVDGKNPKLTFSHSTHFDKKYDNFDTKDAIWYRRKINYTISEHDKIKEKAIKAAYDLLAFARSLKAEGYTIDKINEIINRED